MGVFRIDSGKIFKKMAGLNVLNENEVKEKYLLIQMLRWNCC
jgi:hypothetical protein